MWVFYGVLPLGTIHHVYQVCGLQEKWQKKLPMSNHSLGLKISLPASQTKPYFQSERGTEKMDKVFLYFLIAQSFDFLEFSSF